jgi:hypothetical protein
MLPVIDLSPVVPTMPSSGLTRNGSVELTAILMALATRTA